MATSEESRQNALAFFPLAACLLRRAPRRNLAPPKPPRGSKNRVCFFCETTTDARPGNSLQVAGTYQENATYVYNFASGCAVAPNKTANDFAVIAVSSSIRESADKYKYTGKKRSEMTVEERNQHDDRLIILHLESYQNKRGDYMKRANISGNILISYYSNQTDLEQIIDINVNDKTKVVRTVNHAGRQIEMGDGTTVVPSTFEETLANLVKYKNIETSELRLSADTRAIYCLPGYPRNVSEVDRAIYKALMDASKPK